jgi:DnaJ-class molecular chaperone
METTDNSPRLSAEQRHRLRVLIDQTVRTRLTVDSRYACKECQGDTRELSTPVKGCATCHERTARRRRRQNT